MILKAKHNFLLDPFFRYYVVWKMKKEFNPVKFTGEIIDRDLPVLLIANHVSWWDGIWAYYVNKKLFRKKFYFMMLEEQLRENWFFKYTGGFSIRKNSRSTIESIEYTADLLGNSNNMVLIFPQGDIHSMYNHEFKFKKGTEKILQKTTGGIQVVFLANFIEYLSNPKPTLFIYIQEYNGTYKMNEIQKEYNGFYKNSLNAQKQISV